MGSCLAEAISRCHEELRVEVYETLGLWELGVFEGRDVVVFIDSIMKPADSPRVLKVETSSPAIAEVYEAIESLDPHDVSPSMLAIIASASGLLRGECFILGIPAKRIEAGAGVSEEALLMALDSLRLLERLLESRGCRVRLDRGCVEREMRRACSQAGGWASSTTPGFVDEGWSSPA